MKKGAEYPLPLISQEDARHCALLVKGRTTVYHLAKGLSLNPSLIKRQLLVRRRQREKENMVNCT